MGWCNLNLFKHKVIILPARDAFLVHRSLFFTNFASSESWNESRFSASASAVELLLCSLQKFNFKDLATRILEGRPIEDETELIKDKSELS